jgi:tripartite ATP-independent transporter DctP family solute receptor
VKEVPVKRIIAALAVLAVAAFVASAEATQEQAGGTITLTWSTASVPGDAHTEAIPVVKAELEKLSNGTMTIDYYHSGQLFSQNDDQNAAMMGKVDMVYSSAAWLAQHVPTMSMFAAAFTFQSYTQMTKTFNGPTGDKVFEQALKLGYRPLMAYYLGTRQLNLTEKVGPITKPEQMKNVKFRVPNAPAWIAMGKALGANPTPMAFGEVYMGLKTGTIDGQDNPLPTDQAAKFYEVTKYIVLTSHVVDSVWPTINEKKWQSLSKKQQGWLMKALEKGREFCDTTNLKKEETILDFFKQQGLVIVDKPDKAAFAAYAKNFYATEGKDISKDWDWALYDSIQKIK